MKRTWTISTLIAFLAGLILCGTALAADPKPNADAKERFLRYGRNATRDFLGVKNLVPDFASNPEGFGVKLTVEKYFDKGGWKTVEKDHVFSSDDRVRFSFQANGSAYVTLINNGNVIWPHKGGRNLVPDTAFQHSGNKEVLGPFRVKPPAGMERNVLILSPIPFSQQAQVMESIPAGASWNQAAPTAPPAPSAPQSVEMSDIASIEAQLGSVSGAARNLVFEEEGNDTYVVSNESGGVKPIRYPFELIHR